jgi:hypothetical protein
MKTPNVIVIGHADIGKTTANIIEHNNSIVVNPAFEPEPILITAPPTMPLFNQEVFYRVQSTYTEPTKQKKFRKKNNRKHKKRK